MPWVQPFTTAIRAPGNVAPNSKAGNVAPKEKQGTNSA